MERERDLIREKLTECHLDEQDYGEQSGGNQVDHFRTEVRDNFVPQRLQKPKLSRRDIYRNRLYEEMTRKVIIEHEMDQKRAVGSRRPSEYVDHFSHSAWTPIDYHQHTLNAVRKIDDAITFWSVKSGSTKMRKDTGFSKPIAEQLDSQFH